MIARLFDSFVPSRSIIEGTTRGTTSIDMLRIYLFISGSCEPFNDAYYVIQSATVTQPIHLHTETDYVTLAE